jgi:hypothetical protein
MVGFCYWFSLCIGGFVMNVLFLFIDIFLAIFLAFQAGQIKAMIDVDKIDGKKPEKMAYFLLVADLVISLYLVISIYGMGMRHVP